ncbi:MAG: OmpH family outer membrane protein [Caldiserica bacterium]|nr:OmpH family outer membrane protein [Caldisericota bacterium]
MKRLGLLLLVGFMVLITGTLFAGETKIACADLFKVFQSYSETKKADAYLKEKANSFQEEISKIRSDISSIEKVLGSGTLSKEAKAQKSKELAEKKQALEEKIKASNLIMMQERKEKVDKILQDLEAKVAEFAKKKGYQIILDKKSALYIDEGLDVTEQIVKYVNEGK